MKKLLTRHDLIKEDRYQMLQTLIEVVRDRKNITENTQFMIKMMEESESIEEALGKIVRKVEFTAKIISRIQDSEFPHRLIRNYSLGTDLYSNPFKMQNIETIL